MLFAGPENATFELVMRPSHVQLSILISALLGACGKSSDNATEDRCTVGSEGCACTDGGGCDPDLGCRSNICVVLLANAAGDGDGSGGDDNGSGGGDGGQGDGDEPGSGGAAQGSGGISGDGGGSLMGGAEATGGNGGAGGTQSGGASGAVAALGSECDRLAALACAGNNQQVSIVCDGETWTVNQTCPTDQACDSASGVTQGTCQPRIGACSTSDKFCEDESTLAECGPDHVNVTTEQCAHACRDGECDDRPNYCPVGDFTNCGEECSGGDSSLCMVNEKQGCMEFTGVVVETTGATPSVRTPAYGDACTIDWCQTSEQPWGIFQVVVAMDSPAPVKIRTDGNLLLVDGSDCPEPGAVSQCIVLVPDDDRVTVGAMTDDPSMLEQNLFMEVQAPGETLSCP
jgi:hypothetical protein